jgi:hypothetical protein
VNQIQLVIAVEQTDEVAELVLGGQSRIAAHLDPWRPVLFLECLQDLGLLAVTFELADDVLADHEGAADGVARGEHRYTATGQPVQKDNRQNVS